MNKVQQILLLLFVSIWGGTAAKAQQIRQGQCTVEVSVSGVIGLSNYHRVLKSKEKAIKNKCSSVLVVVNTPGGSLETTRKIVTEILNSSVPFLCLVYPSGAHAGSAGAIILQACHVSGAVKATNIGAATPISGTGQDAGKDLRKKLINDTTSWLEGITQLRKRNQEFSKDIIVDAKAVSATEAHRLGAIDFLAESKLDFLSKSAGQKVSLAKSKQIEVQVGDLLKLNEGLKEKTLDLLADPQHAYMMFMASLGLLYFELTHPGVVAPGVIGAIGLVVSMVSLHKMEIEWGAFVLILLGLAFLVAEAFVPSFGMLGVGGGVALFLGSLFLFDPATTGYRLPYATILPIAILFTGFSLFIAHLAFKSRSYKSRSNEAILLESKGFVVEIKNNEYWVEVNGERWKAKCDEDLQKGDQVLIKSINKLLLSVTKV